MQQCTEVHFVSLLSGGFITAIVVNPPERKLVKRTSVHCTHNIEFLITPLSLLKVYKKVKMSTIWFLVLVFGFSSSNE